MLKKFPRDESSKETIFSARQPYYNIVSVYYNNITDNRPTDFFYIQLRNATRQTTKFI